MRSGLFDAAFYRAHNRRRDLDPNRALQHFLTEGAALGLPPHRLFDPAFYRGQSQAASAATNPLIHYLRYGWKRGLRPSPAFDPAHYARANPDVRLAGFEPLSHYAARGEREGREGAAAAVRCSMPTEPTEEEWARLPSHPKSSSARVDVVMPVHSGRTETLRAIQRVLSARNCAPFELIVVNDASPDAVLVDRLQGLARAGHITLLHQSSNVGFVASVNCGMALNPSRDVVLLNADTEVHGDWLDRLVRIVAQDARVGTVTPWSSDATILSYPIRLRPNPMCLECSDEQLDRLAAGLASDLIELPTAVGSCMYIKRACLDLVGRLDEARFGRGYGEENDFSCRVRRLGWRNVAAPSVFVRHHGARSFAGEKAERIQRALATMAELHPDYLSAVHAFNKADPLRIARQHLDEARIRASAPTHILSDGARPSLSSAADAGLLFAEPAVGPRFGAIALRSDRVPITPNLPLFDAHDSPAGWARLAAALNITAVCIGGETATLASALQAMAQGAGLPVLKAADR